MKIESYKFDKKWIFGIILFYWKVVSPHHSILHPRIRTDLLLSIGSMQQFDDLRTQESVFLLLNLQGSVLAASASGVPTDWKVPSPSFTCQHLYLSHFSRVSHASASLPWPLQLEQLLQRGAQSTASFQALVTTASSQPQVYTHLHDCLIPHQSKACEAEDSLQLLVISSVPSLRLCT